MKLEELMEGIEFSQCDENKFSDIDIKDIVYNSKNAGPEKVFIAIVGETVDGHKFVKDAYDKGVRVFVTSHDVDLDKDAIELRVANTRIALSRMSHNFFAKPSTKMKLIGVTGTKGKTTISSYLSHVLNENGISTGTIGTNGIFYNGKYETTMNTTPESYELHRIFKEMLDDGVKCVCIEASSGGMMMHRVDDVDFDIVLFNNISPDHIGPKEHPSFEDYLECKAKLFTFSKFGFVNDDDEKAKFIRTNAKCPVEGFAIHKESDLRAKNRNYHRSIDKLGVEFDCEYKNQELGRFFISNPGEFSVYNALAVIAICQKLGLTNDQIKKTLATAKVDGRVEVLNLIPDVSIIIDYAHNGVSLENVLKTLLEYKPKRLICLFGSVGGRTAIRRKEMGDVAAKLCDIAIITSDNPDDEDPVKVIEDIAESFINSPCQVYKEVDREKAIRFAVDFVEPGDMLVLAGKGHEKYQYVNGERVFFDEKAITIDAAKKRLNKIK